MHHPQRRLENLPSLLRVLRRPIHLGGLFIVTDDQIQRIARGMWIAAAQFAAQAAAELFVNAEAELDD